MSDDNLAEILSRRLEVFSASRNLSAAAIKQFSDLSLNSPHVDEHLVRAAGGSPRRLIDLARRIIEYHCQQASDPDELIDAQTVGQVLDEAAPPATLSGIDSPLLFFNKQNGDIWVGGKLKTGTPLTKQLRHAMEYLWDNRRRTVPYDELQHVLYGDTLDKRGDPKSSCDKIIRRLRDVIEPGSTRSRIYIDIQPGIGYVLRNFQEADDMART